MSSNRYAKCAVLMLVLLLVGSAAADETSPNIRLELHWDREAGTSKSIVKAGEDVLAEVTWDGALPRTYATSTDQSEIPTFIVGSLRDELAGSSHLHADRAWAFVRGLMGSHADTPLSQLNETDQTWISYSELQVTETCGTVVDTNAECTQPSPSQLPTTFCSQSVCKVTEIRPLEGVSD